MFDSMNMHMPTVIFFVALLGLLVISGLYVAIRLAGQRVVDKEAAGRVPPAPTDSV